jgi:hypothetical protein
MDVLSFRFPLALPFRREKEPSCCVYIPVLKIYFDKYKDIFICLFDYTK